MKGDDIADRLLNFAKHVLALHRRFPENFAGKHIARQLIRCSSSAGPNFEEGVAPRAATSSTRCAWRDAPRSHGGF